jgi:membrane protease YdiL (CAAX protease family)
MSPNGSAPGKTFPWPAAIAATLAGIFAMFGGAGFVVHTRPGLGLRALLAIGSLALALPSAAALAARPDWWPSVRGASIRGRTLGLSMLLGAALWVASAGLIEMQSLLMPPSSRYLDDMRAIHTALAPQHALDALVSVLVIALLPGVCEELVMRGVLLPSLAKAFRGTTPPLQAPDAGRRSARSWPGEWLAIGITALLFALIHWDRYRFLFVLVLGLVFGYVRMRAGSLWPSVIAHATLNTLTFVIAPLVDDPTQAYVPNPGLGAACLLAGSAVAWPLLRALAPRIVDSPRPPS